MNDALLYYHYAGRLGPEWRWADEDYLLHCQQELTRDPHPNDRPWWRDSRIIQVSITSQILNGTFPYEFEPIKKEGVR